MSPIAPIPFLRRSWYFADIDVFQRASDDIVLAQLVRGSAFPVMQTQRDAWLAQLPLLRNALNDRSGKIYLEFAIPRMGHRVDAIILIHGLVLVVEFKIGAKEHSSGDFDQAYDYAMDLKYFHEASHNLSVVPILVATQANSRPFRLVQHKRIAGLYETICSSGSSFPDTIKQLLITLPKKMIEPHVWENSRYCPTPTIIEAARALYAGHGVSDISRSDAGAINLRDTSDQLAHIIENTKDSGHKAICFVTGVPGAGKTLVGLNMDNFFQYSGYSDPFNLPIQEAWLWQKNEFPRIIQKRIVLKMLR